MNTKFILMLVFDWLLVTFILLFLVLIYLGLKKLFKIIQQQKELKEMGKRFV